MFLLANAFSLKFESEGTRLPSITKNISRLTNNYTVSLWFKPQITNISNPKMIFTLTLQPEVKCRNLQVFISPSNNFYYVKYQSHTTELVSIFFSVYPIPLTSVPNSDRFLLLKLPRRGKKICVNQYCNFKWWVIVFVNRNIKFVFRYSSQKLVLNWIIHNVKLSASRTSTLIKRVFSKSMQILRNTFFWVGKI